MQTADASSRLNELDRDLIEMRVRRVVDLRTRGDIAGMLEFVAPDIVYAGGTWKHYPFQARREGREAVADMARAINVHFEYLGAIINRLLIDGDRVAMHRTVTIRNRGGGKAVTVDIWNFLRFRDGLIIEFSEYPDTAAVASIGDTDE